jgi:hypothetical protein
LLTGYLELQMFLFFITAKLLLAAFVPRCSHQQVGGWTDESARGLDEMAR